IGWVGDVVAYALTVAPPQKVLVGLPFYGYSWTRGRPPARATTWEAAARLVEQFELTPQRDEASAELAVELDASGLPKQELWVSDASTTAARLEALAPRAIGGVAIWGVGGEDPAHWQVLRERRPGECR